MSTRRQYYMVKNSERIYQLVISGESERGYINPWSIKITKKDVKELQDLGMKIYDTRVKARVKK